MRNHINAIVASVVALSAGFAATARATAVSIVNPGFESDAAADGGAVAAAIGWNLGGSDSFSNFTYDPPAAAGNATNAKNTFAGDTNNFLLSNGGDSANSGATGFTNVTQVIPTATIQPNTRYTLSLDVGNLIGPTVFPAVTSGDVVTDHLQTRLVLNGGGPLSGNADTSLVSSTAHAVASGDVDNFTLIYETGANPANIGNDLYIQLVASKSVPGGSITQVMFDNVSLDMSPVPEPASALASAGLLLLGAAGRRPRRRCVQG
jgi:hypothetical protein